MPDEELPKEETEEMTSQTEADQEAEPEPTAPPDITMISSEPDSQVLPAEFSQIEQSFGDAQNYGMDLILDVQLNVAVELGRSSLKVKEILGLGPGAVVELDKRAGEPVEVVINNKVIARGEVVIVDENFGVRITEIINANEKASTNAKAA